MKRLATIAICLAAVLFAWQAATAQDVKNPKQDLPKLLNGTNAGTEFWISYPPCYAEVFGGNNSLRIFIASGARQPITVEVPGKGFTQTKIAVPNDVIEFIIPLDVGQPYYKNVQEKAPPEKIYPGAGVHITSLAPIICYGVTRFQYTSDGFLAVPLSALGQDYVVASWPQYTAAGSGFKLPGISNVVAAYDDTKMTFTMGGNTASRTTGGLRPGQSRTWTMKKGDVVCFANDDDAQDIAGSRVVADKPIAVVSGNQCANVPAGVPWCDYTVEMELPTNTWGKEYHVTPIVQRAFNPVIRIFAHPDYKNVKVYRDGQEWLVLPNNTRVENQAYVERRVFDGGPRSTVISADKPIYIMLYNTGQADDNVPSDPFQIVLTPIEQYQKEIVFATPGAKGGTLPFKQHYVNLVYAVGDGDVIPDDLEFAPVYNGKFEWVRVSTRFGTNPGQSFVVKSANGLQYFMKRLTLPGDGVYRLRAKTPFAAYAYGFADYDSYGFPTSVALGDLTRKDTVCPNPVYVVKCDGSVAGATVTDRPNDLEVRSNLALIYMDIEPDSSYNYEFKYDKNKNFIPGQTVTTDWTLDVVDQTQDARAKLVFVDRAGNDTSIVVEYFAFKAALVALGSSPTNLDYGVVKSNQLTTQQFKAVNNSAAPITITRIELKKKNQGFTIQNLTLPFTLDPGAEKIFDITFSNVADGIYEDSIGIGDDCVFLNMLQARAEIASPIIRVSDLNFQTVPVNQTRRLSFLVENIGKADLKITDMTALGLTQYTLTNPPTISQANPLIIARNGQAVQIEVEFAPLTVGKFDDQIVFSSDAKDIDSICLITGRSVAPGLYAVGHDWNRHRVGSSNGGGTLELFNNGTQAVTVLQAKNTSTEFEFDATLFIQKTIGPGESFSVPVIFKPSATGVKSLTVEFDNNANIPDVKADLNGTGIIPRITTTDYDFGMTTINAAVPNTRLVTITNTTWAFGDAVTITDLGINPIGGIATVQGTYGTEGFGFAKAGLNLPVTLQMGESLTFNADFSAQRAGAAAASVTTVSDAEAEVTSNWIGQGDDPFVPVRGITAVFVPQPPICVGSTQDLSVIVGIDPAANVDLQVNSFEFVPPLPEFTLLTTNNFDIVPGGPAQTLTIRFSPTSVGTFTTKLRIFNSADNVREVDIVATSESYTRNVVVAPIGRNATQNVTIGSKDEIGISLTAGPPDISLAAINRLDVEVQYNESIISYVDNSLASGLQGFVVSNVIVTRDPNPSQTATSKISFSLTSTTDIVNPASLLAKMQFLVVLPNVAVTSSSEVKITVVAPSSPCVVFEGTPITVVQNPVCADNLRRVGSSGKAYSMMNVTPNPVTSSGADVEFSVGLKAQTRFEIYNGSGQLVKTVGMGSLEPGDYQVSIPVEDLTSGSYSMKMISGLFSSTIQLVVTK